MDVEMDIDILLEKVGADLISLSEMLNDLDPFTTDWLQIDQYLSWVKVKMISVYQIECDYRILNHIKSVDDLIKRANEKYIYVNGM